MPTTTVCRSRCNRKELHAAFGTDADFGWEISARYLCRGLDNKPCILNHQLIQRASLPT